MQYIKGFENYHNERQTAITLGKFDGLHRGHELLVERVIAFKKQEAVDAVVFAFDMQPLYEKLGQEYRPLLSGEEKAARLQGRIDYFVECPFTEEISSMEAEDFIRRVLVERFHVKYIVVGNDFRFGHKRHGDVQMLQEYAERFDYQLEVLEKICYGGREISSTYIKEERDKGNAALVDELLGYVYTVRK
ncbi:MAG: hypothetical protein UHS49_04750 [Faecalimonas sp.]|nr:hypothetical protein [Faecalimonas sp.]